MLAVWTRASHAVFQRDADTQRLGVVRQIRDGLSADLVLLLGLLRRLSPAVPAGVQDTADRPANGSVTETPVNVTAPVFSPSNVYVTTSPATTPLSGEADLVRLTDAACDAVTVAETVPALLKGMVDSGMAIPLNPEKRPPCYLFRSHPSDVAPVENRTFIASEKQEDAGIMIGWTTAVSAPELERVGDAYLRPPTGFAVHPKLQQLCERGRGRKGTAGSHKGRPPAQRWLDRDRQRRAAAAQF